MDNLSRPQGRSRRDRILRLVLVVSLALNLLVAGLIVGRALGGPPFGGGRPGFDVALGPLLGELEKGDRDAIRERLRGEAAFHRGGGRRGEIRAALAAAIAADPYDAGAVAALLEEEAERLEALQDAARQAFLDRLEAIGPEGRSEYARRLAGSTRRQ